MKLAIITTHPIQYYAPLFRLLALSDALEIKVFYTWSQSKDKVYDVDFKIERSWDINLLEGYDHVFVNNVSRSPGSHHFGGIKNPALTMEVERWGADAVLVYGWNFSSHLQAMRYFKGRIPVYFRGDSTMLDESVGFSIKKIARRIVLTWVYHHVDFALYVGTANKNYYLAHGLKHDQLIYAPHAIDINRFAANDDEQNALALKWREELDIAADDIVFLFAGKLSKKKNPEILVQAFKKIRNREKVKLVIAGNGDLESVLKARYGRDKDIRFIGFQNQSIMPVLFRLGDVYILPSKGPGETWGLAVNEAMASSRPVLVSNQCGCAFDLVRENVNGFVFESCETDDLVAKISLLLDKQVLHTMGQASFDIIQDWNYSRFVRALENSLQETLLQKPG